MMSQEALETANSHFFQICIININTPFTLVGIPFFPRWLGNLLIKKKLNLVLYIRYVFPLLSQAYTYMNIHSVLIKTNLNYRCYIIKLSSWLLETILRKFQAGCGT